MLIPMLALLLTVAACVLLYLSHRHQGWLRQPLPAWPARASGAGLLLLALACGLSYYSPLTAVCAWLMVQMLAFSTLPLLSLLRRGHG
ncbi:hypothetical protein [Duganella vulcania]|uniref:DUF3325 family protein n=1 Tax=Duganella vulcania TaxID=2692166 RepID=A0A845GRP0_9BURK|nr:hypothetical protein [Duganella vulcania]MYM95249.1 hypothetical protein [Duganella vulcania]